jgi:predicted tellurium resistance membrane protein TerC
MEWITTAEGWIALLTLTALEIVLGIDNIIFISILSGKLPSEQQKKARTLGLALAMLTRIGLLLSISWVMRLTTPLFTIFREFSGRDLILVVGGLFLIAKSTHEIHDKLEGAATSGRKPIVSTFAGVIFQIILLDIIFSLDSVITAVGMVQHLSIMIVAVVIAVIFMMFFARVISDFVHDHPTVKMLALAFLLLIGAALIAEGFDTHIPKGYIYFAMAFSVFVEMLNLRLRRASTHPVELRSRYPEEEAKRGGTGGKSGKRK